MINDATATQGIKVVTIGGGTGSFMLLSALRHYVSDLTAIVNMSDDGGSTGVLRDELGTLPPGDIRQCLVALSDSPEYMRTLLNYRFDEGMLKGHSFGNILITALEKTSGNFADAVKLAEHVLQVRGRVLPVTTEDIRLVATMSDGTQVKLERNIQDHLFNNDRPLLSLDPHPQVNPEAAQAIRQADIVVVGPGDLYSSLIPVLLPEGMAQALKESQATVIYVSNLVNKPGKTDGMAVHDYTDQIERHLGGNVFDFVLYNTAKPGRELTEKYMREGETPVAADGNELAMRSYVALGERLLAGGVEQSDADVLLKRNLMRHDGEALARVIMRIYFS